MRSPLSWAIPVVVLLAGCAREHRAPATPAARQTTTTTTVVERQTPSVANPPTAIGGGPNVDVGTDGPERLDPARADRMVEERKNELHDACYTVQSGVVSFIIDVIIAPDGRVESAKTASVEGNPDVAECVRGKIEKMTFPQTNQGGTHTFTFLFTQ